MYFRDSREELPTDGLYVILVSDGLVVFEPMRYDLSSKEALAILEVVDGRKDRTTGRKARSSSS